MLGINYYVLLYYVIMRVVLRNQFSRLSRNIEAFDSEILENLEHYVTRNSS